MSRWRGAAACSAEDPDLFFSELGEDIRRARKICRGCAALVSCRAEARAGDEHGIWGGETRHDRTYAPPCGTYRAASAHYKRGEALDPACRSAFNAYQQAARARRAAA